MNIKLLKPSDIFDVSIASIDAGNNLEYNISEENSCLLLISFGLTLTTSGTAGTRKFAFQFVNRNNSVLYQLVDETGQAASLVHNYYGIISGGITNKSGGFSSDGISRAMPLPILPIISGDILKTSISNMSGNDIISNIHMRFILLSQGTF